MSALPKQVVQQQREVEEIEKQLYAQPAEAEQTDGAPVASEGAPAETPTNEVPQNVVELKQEPPTDWEQKYRTLKGMFDAEVPRLHEQNKDLARQLQTLSAQFDAMKKPAEPAPALVTDKDVETFGSDLIDVQRRVVREELKSELDARDKRIAQLEAQLAQTGGQVETMSFEQRLNLRVPDFVKLNSDPAWVAFLNEVDPLTGEPRRAYAQAVYNAGDVERVAKVVDLFRSMQGTPDATRAQAKRELERQVAPSRTATASAPVQGTEKFYTEAEMTRLFAKVRDLNIQGKYDEAQKLEAELSLAYVQGRVRP